MMKVLVVSQKMTTFATSKKKDFLAISDIDALLE